MEGTAIQMVIGPYKHYNTPKEIDYQLRSWSKFGQIAVLIINANCIFLWILAIRLFGANGLPNSQSMQM